MNIMRWIAAATIATATAIGSAMAAGNLTGGATPIKIDMTVDKKFSTTSIQMETGKAYLLEITKVAGDEWRFMAPDLFNNSYIYQIAISGKEIKTRHIDFLEFDDPGTIAITLVPNRVGVFKFWVPGQEATMTGTITVK
ncbi:MAG: hypothetical protein EXQ88_01515 [Alphaproteobacteria bacterium]|nr:hypothetical protein [Alphaproteobacteria bacterium]